MATKAVSREIAYQFGNAVLWARRIEYVREDSMAVKYWYRAEIYYKKVCVWSNNVSKKDAYLISDIVKTMHTVDPGWGCKFISPN